MFSWLSGQDTQKNIDHAAKGIDAVFFTKEEKAEMQKSIIQIKVKAAAKQSMARRAIATITVAVWAFLIIAAVLMNSFGADNKASFCLEVLKNTVNQPHSIIVGFYFLKEVVGGWFSGEKK